ncbi:hypothetical protein JZ751_011122 [Albula glossodonta]|uniref:SPARC/Testican calcium-binding domain-containing protein n=1 Tax=Albula glossodonta TaxID=121402 RepID=A0A8T2P496_9TELE|nr:hypothetical protein JZ751_011122 [Albula glossodonta]
MLEPDPSHTLEERVVHWYFSQLDKNSSGDIGKKEIKPFKRLLRKKSKPKKCVKKFVEYCDISNDKALSLQELMGCLGVTKEDGAKTGEGTTSSKQAHPPQTPPPPPPPPTPPAPPEILRSPNSDGNHSICTLYFKIASPTFLPIINQSSLPPPSCPPKQYEAVHLVKWHSVIKNTSVGVLTPGFINLQYPPPLSLYISLSPSFSFLKYRCSIEGAYWVLCLGWEKGLKQSWLREGYALSSHSHNVYLWRCDGQRGLGEVGCQGQDTPTPSCLVKTGARQTKKGRERKQNSHRVMNISINTHSETFPALLRRECCLKEETRLMLSSEVREMPPGCFLSFWLREQDKKPLASVDQILQKRRKKQLDEIQNGKKDTFLHLRCCTMFIGIQMPITMQFVLTKQAYVIEAAPPSCFEGSEMHASGPPCIALFFPGKVIQVSVAQDNSTDEYECTLTARINQNNSTHQYFAVSHGLPQGQDWSKTEHTIFWFQHRHSNRVIKATDDEGITVTLLKLAEQSAPIIRAEKTLKGALVVPAPRITREKCNKKNEKEKRTKSVECGGMRIAVHSRGERCVNRIKTVVNETKDAFVHNSIQFMWPLQLEALCWLDFSHPNIPPGAQVPLLPISGELWSCLRTDTPGLPTQHAGIPPLSTKEPAATVSPNPTHVSLIHWCDQHIPAYLDAMLGRINTTERERERERERESGACTRIHHF